MAACFGISRQITRSDGIFTSGDFKKKCLMVATEGMWLGKKEVFQDISLSWLTVQRHVQLIADDQPKQEEKRCGQFVYFCLFSGECTYIHTYTTGYSSAACPHLWWDWKHWNNQRVGSASSVQELSSGEKKSNKIRNVIKTFKLPWKKLVAVCTDEALAMIAKRNGTFSLLQACGGRKLKRHHCAVYQEVIFAIKIELEHMMKVVAYVFNFARV